MNSHDGFQLCRQSVQLGAQMAVYTNREAAVHMELPVPLSLYDFALDFRAYFGEVMAELGVGG